MRNGFKYLSPIQTWNIYVYPICILSENSNSDDDVSNKRTFERVETEKVDAETDDELNDAYEDTGYDNDDAEGKVEQIFSNNISTHFKKFYK